MLGKRKAVAPPGRTRKKVKGQGSNSSDETGLADVTLTQMSRKNKDPTSEVSYGVVNVNYGTL